MSLNVANLAELRLLIKEMASKIGEAITSAGKTTSDAITKNTEAYQKSQEPKPARDNERVRVEVRLSAEEVRRYYSEQGKTYRLQRRAFRATLGTLLAVAIYAVITFFQWRTMDKTLGEIRQQTGFAERSATGAENAVTQTRDQFRQDQRPYVWLTNNGLGLPAFIPNARDPARGGQIAWAWHFTNYGKSPAYDVRLDSFMQVGNGRFVRSFRDPPNPRPDRGAPLPPNKDDFDSAVSPPGINGQQFNALVARQNAGRTISILVWIEYTDSYRKTYLTTFCLRWLNTQVVGYCIEGNGIR